MQYRFCSLGNLTELLNTHWAPGVGIFKLITSDIGRPIGDIVNILQYASLADDMRKVLGNLIPLEQQVLDDNGFWYLLKIQPYRTENDMVEGIVLTLVDITKQKHLEVALAVSEERRASILDQTGEGFFLVDYKSGSLIDSNAEFQKLTGRHAWELKNMKVWELVSHAAMESTRKMFSRKRAKNFETKSKETFLGSDGTSITVELHSKVITIGSRKYPQCFVSKYKK